MFFSTIGIFILIGIYYFKKQRARMVKMMEKFEGPPLLPLIGNGLMLLGNPTRAHASLQTENKKYAGRPYRMWVMLDPVIVIHHYSDVSIAFKIIKKDESYTCLGELIGEGLITANGEKWKRNRAMIEPAFNTHMLLEHIFYILVKHSNNLVAELSLHEKTEVDMWKFIYKTAFNTIHDMTMGYDEKFDEETVNKFEESRSLELLTKRIYTPYLRPSIIFKIFSFLVTGETNTFKKARSLFDQLIERSKRRYMDRKYRGNLENEKKKIIMDFLLDAGCSDEVIRDEIITLFCAGTETNANTLCYTLLMLAMHPKIQDQVYDELRTIFGNSDRLAEPSDLSKMTFLEQCLKESLRTTPPPVVLRRAQHDATLNDGRIIPAGAIVMVSVFDIHHNPELYPDPYTWNPHNFDAEKVATRPAYSFIPFGGGPRICIGYRYAMMAMKIMLATILRHYELKTSCTKTTMHVSVIVKVKEGYKVQLHRRKKATD